MSYNWGYNQSWSSTSGASNSWKGGKWGKGSNSSWTPDVGANQTWTPDSKSAAVAAERPVGACEGGGGRPPWPPSKPPSPPSAPVGACEGDEGRPPSKLPSKLQCSLKPWQKLPALLVHVKAW